MELALRSWYDCDYEYDYDLTIMIMNMNMITIIITIMITVMMIMVTMMMNIWRAMMISTINGPSCLGEVTYLWWWWDSDDDAKNDPYYNDYDDNDDYDDADLKAQLARIDPAKIAGPLETAFQDVVNVDPESSIKYVKSKHLKERFKGACPSQS